MCTLRCSANGTVPRSKIVVGMVRKRVYLTKQQIIQLLTILDSFSNYFS